MHIYRQNLDFLKKNDFFQMFYFIDIILHLFQINILYIDIRLYNTKTCILIIIKTYFL